MTAVAEGSIELGTIAQAEAEQFLYREARLADAHDYDGWEALWTDDAIYWVPAGGESAEDPNTQVSVLFDNRSRIGTRIRQLKSGKRHSQTPKSNVVHQITNVEVLGLQENGDTEVVASLLAVESRERGTTFWAGRVEYRLRRVDTDQGSELRLAFKKVTLVDRDQPLYTLSFLI
ncbi:aromatic-ring-hydroxylating dioxygenase subunit beta [Sporichthya sp.]|uniref:aromatic-ring-hydroxylating dioxygenase subunit beta n=1 Tax=Sporichthya sp. TaxID=65475 RepID=UPI001838DB2A|nr:aromatic-ring-hydroxylating dioxygenase subunit beta [Sporichthya sp.]MBA3741886.1 nuclear transport factor 2 family protein [Sporichthya sp.]